MISKRTPSPEKPLPAYAPKELVRRDFGRRLQTELVRKGWNQSELARQAALHMPEKTFGRDLVSGYVRGRILPGPIHLNAICKALQREPAELMPATAATDGQVATSPISTQDLGDNRVLLTVNQVVDWPVALQVLQILKGKQRDGKG